MEEFKAVPMQVPCRRDGGTRPVSLLIRQGDWVTCNGCKNMDKSKACSACCDDALRRFVRNLRGK